jgi:hypothetical protein
MVQGWGGERLLATYETERKPIAIRNTDVARDMGKAWHDIAVTEAIEQDSPAGAAERASAAQSSFVVENHFVRPEERDWLGVVLGARYDGSPIVIADGAPPPDEKERYVPSDVPGGRAPHLWLDDRRGAGSSLFDRLGTFFTLLRFAGASQDTARIEAAARRAGVPLDVLDIDHPQARDLYQGKLVLIRPDQHIAWRGDDLPQDVDRLLATVVGR